jgi:acyl-CoA synthetase (NDP forming)
MNRPDLNPLAGRAVYRHDEMSRLLNPRSVCIVGASARPGSFGARLEANLAEFDGDIYLVNAKYDRLGERPCYPSIADLPVVPDCVVITVGRDAVEGVVRECVAAGVGGAVIYASGYAETGKADGAALQRTLSEIAGQTGMRLIGPNSIGLCNFVSQAKLTFGPVPQASRPRRPAIGLVSQSGAVGQGLMQAIEHGVSFSHVLTSGNSCDVDVADLVSYLADDPDCDAIGCVFEGMSNPLRMISAAEIAARAGKPLIIYKMATGTQGAEAAMSHTGSLAGSNQVYQAAFERAGAIVVDRLEDLIEAASFFAKAPLPKAAGVAVISTSGGGAVICADKAEVHGVDLPQPGPAAKAVLEARIPDFGSARNPCDITAQVLNDPESLSACMDALMRDDAFGIVVHPHPVAYAAATPRIATLGEIAAEHGKFAAVVWMNQWLEGVGAREAETNPHVALFRSMDSCFAAIAAWNRRAERIGRDSIDAPERLVESSTRGRVGLQLRNATERVISERAAKPMLSAYGIRTTEERLVTSRDQARMAAAELGYPLVAKVDSAAIPHKTDAGVVRLNLLSQDELDAAYDAIMANALKVTTPDRISGVLLQPMVPSGLEIIVGGRVDPQFGPLVVVGIGGIFVELLKDSAIALAPVNRAEARQLLASLKHFDLLLGFRGAEPVNLDLLSDVVARVSEFMVDHAGQVEEVDINPLICAGSQVVAVDGLIVLHRQAASPVADVRLVAALTV